MSKSAGNAIALSDMLDKYSGDAIRYWASEIKLGEDLAFKESNLVDANKFMTKIWNAYRFIAPHLDETSDEMSYLISDKWILNRTDELVESVTEEFDKYEYNKAGSEIRDFFWHDFCDNYLEMAKSRLYDETADTRTRTAAKDTLYQVLLNSLKLLSPIMPHLTEEIYQNFSREDCKSIHLSQWPEQRPELRDPEASKLGNLEVSLLYGIRKWKNEHKLSLSAKVDNLTVKCPNPDEIHKIEKEVSRAMNIGNLKIEEGGFSIGG